MDLSSVDSLSQIAFYINAYNLSVIHLVNEHFPLSSVKEVSGFFESKKLKIAGQTLTLNQLEKKMLIDPTQDNRLHFVLVCGAKGCPPLIDRAYFPETLDAQMEEQTKLALNDPEFIKVEEEGKVGLSQIFNWYATDFGTSKKNVLSFINTYRENKIPESNSVYYYEYDWSLNSSSPIKMNNGGGNNAIRYVVSSTIPKGTSELKIFNNLYSKNINDYRSSFFSTSFSYLFGVSGRLNVGISGRYRRVKYGSVSENSVFSVLGSAGNSRFRQGLTLVGPQIRWAPVKKWGNFSIQSQFLIPTGRDQKGSLDGSVPFIDWAKPVWWTQVFNDFSLGNSFSLFAEIDLLIEDLGRQADPSSANPFVEGEFNQFSIPVTGILSYFPHPKVTLYGLTSVSPQANFVFKSNRGMDVFYQLGSGAKYQITPKFELELLYTHFRNTNIIRNRGSANTFNFGMRVSF